MQISNILLYLKEFHITFFPKKFAKSIVGVKACILNPEKQVLLIQRSATDRHNPLKWEFPGGAVKHQEGIIKTLKREVMEETGLEVELSSTLADIFYQDEGVLSKSIYSGFRRYVFTYSCKIDPCNKKLSLSSEHAGYKWVDIFTALKMDLTDYTKSYIKKYFS